MWEGRRGSGVGEGKGVWGWQGWEEDWSDWEGVESGGEASKKPFGLVLIRAF